MVQAQLAQRSAQIVWLARLLVHGKCCGLTKVSRDIIFVNVNAAQLKVYLKVHLKMVRAKVAVAATKSIRGSGITIMLSRT